MKAPIPFDHGTSAVKLVAHRGLSAVERENTCAAFIAAGNRPEYWGIETDVYPTPDGQYALLHDNRTGRVAPVDLPIRETPYETLKEIRLYDTDGVVRSDLRVPLLSEYARICRRYGKVSVLELKVDYTERQLSEIIDILKAADQLEHTVFISFPRSNMVALRKMLPTQPLQWLTGDWKDEYFDFINENDLDVDAAWTCMTPETVAAIHAAGHKVNLWTIDEPEVAARFAAAGTDYITTNALG